VAFTVDSSGTGPPGREGFVDALDAACAAEGLPPSRRLTLYDGTTGIARCAHTELGGLVRALLSITTAGGAHVEVSTVATSGTIKKAKDHLRALGDR
jgi:RNase P/RNase MRP subunit POP5